MKLPALVSPELMQLRMEMFHLRQELEAAQFQAQLSRVLTLEEAARVVSPSGSITDLNAEAVAGRIRGLATFPSAFVAISREVAQKALGELEHIEGCCCHMDEDFCHHGTVKILRLTLLAAQKS